MSTSESPAAGFDTSTAAEDGAGGSLGKAAVTGVEGSGLEAGGGEELVAATPDAGGAETTGALDSAAFGSAAAGVTVEGLGLGGAGGRLLAVRLGAGGAAFGSSVGFGAAFCAVTEGLVCLLESTVVAVGPCA